MSVRLLSASLGPIIAPDTRLNVGRGLDALILLLLEGWTGDIIVVLVAYDFVDGDSGDVVGDMIRVSSSEAAGPIAPNGVLEFFRFLLLKTLPMLLFLLRDAAGGIGGGDFVLMEYFCRSTASPEG